LSWLLFATCVYAVVLVAIIILNATGADRYWPGALNLYLPQIMWALPGVLLAILIFRVDRAWIWAPILCVLWVLGPVMGFRWPPREAWPAPGNLTLRVMTWNIKYGSHPIEPLIDELVRRDLDVVFFQDATGCMDGPLGDYFRNWEVRSSGQYVIASRYPLSEAEVHELPSSGHQFESFLRCKVRVGDTAVALYNVHLKTPRRSLNGFRTARHEPNYLPAAIQTFHDNVRLRQGQATALIEYISEERGPIIVAGDLNAPDASLVCDTLRNAGLHDAFAERGKGYGFTYGHFLFKHRLPWLRFSWMRIDHIMPSSGFATQRCVAGSGKASDHRPVIADLFLRYP